MYYFLTLGGHPKMFSAPPSQMLCGRPCSVNTACLFTTFKKSTYQNSPSSRSEHFS